MGDLETELIARNTLALVLKSFPAARLLAWSPLILGYQAYTLARAVRRGSWRAVLRGWAGALRHLPGTLRARREVRARTRDPARRSTLHRRDLSPALRPDRRQTSHARPIAEADRVERGLRASR